MRRPEPELPVAIGDVVADKYRVERLIGRGGMGSVFQATHVQLLQRVALKFLSSTLLRQEDAHTRFLREARAAAALTTEHVARTMDFGVLPSGIPYLVIEYLEGEDLASRLERGPLPVDEAVRLVTQACDALGEAHRLGIVHRDIKPHNLFLVRRPNGAISMKVLDFGIAKVDDPNLNAEVITGTCAVMGTPQYMAPEQMASTRTVSASADVWALGVCLYEALTKRRPFESGNMLELGALVMGALPTSITSHRGDLPPALVAVIERCLMKDPARRFPDANELGAALASSQQKVAVVVAPPTLVNPQFLGPPTPAPMPRQPAPPPTALHSPRTSVMPGAPQLPTSTSFGTNPDARAPAAEPPRVSSKTSTTIGLVLVALVVVVAVVVKIVRGSRDTTTAAPTETPPAALVPPPQPVTSNAALPAAATTTAEPPITLPPLATHTASAQPKIVKPIKKTPVTPSATATATARAATEAPDLR